MATSAKSWLSDYGPESLIFEVKSRPIIYMTSLPEYSNKTLKDDAWEEVAENLCDNWENLNLPQKSDLRKELQLKWKHIRDNFRRELQFQKSLTSGQGAKKRKKYRYYDQMLFLIPYVKDATTSVNHTTPEEINDQKQTLPAKNRISPGLPKTPTTKSVAPTTKFVAPTTEPVTPTIQSIPRCHRPRRRRKKINLETEILAMLKNYNKESDEDRTFCISLVPSLKKMDDTTKLTAKIEILNTIRRLSHAETKPAVSTFFDGDSS